MSELRTAEGHQQTLRIMNAVHVRDMML